MKRGSLLNALFQLNVIIATETGDDNRSDVTVVVTNFGAIDLEAKLFVFDVANNAIILFRSRDR
jgi:hypothetical protein